MTTTTTKDVGILALEVYTPRTFVQQAALEAHAGVPAGKYTIGLGQEGLAVTGDAEDINSLCLTVVHSLLEKYVIQRFIYIIQELIWCCQVRVSRRRTMTRMIRGKMTVADTAIVVEHSDLFTHDAPLFLLARSQI